MVTLAGVLSEQAANLSTLADAADAAGDQQKAEQLRSQMKQLRARATDYRRQGAELDPAGKARLSEIDVELTKLTTKFSENVLDSTNAFELVIADEAKLAGLPPTAIEAARESSKIAGRIGGGAGEALVVVGAKSGEHGVGLLHSRGLSQTEFADQTVLASAPEALDAALGLGRIGRNLLDAEICESASEMSGRLLTGELFGDGPVRIVALEDAVTIAVEAERDAVGSDHGAQSAEIAGGVFGFELEVGGEDLFGGVVLKADESEVRTAAFEPVVRTGIGERHHAETWAGRAARAVLARPAFLRRGQLGAAQDAAHGLATDQDVLLGVEFLAEMGIVEALILGAGQG